MVFRIWSFSKFEIFAKIYWDSEIQCFGFCSILYFRMFKLWHFPVWSQEVTLYSNTEGTKNISQTWWAQNSGSAGNNPTPGLSLMLGPADKTWLAEWLSSCSVDEPRLGLRNEGACHGKNHPTVLTHGVVPNQVLLHLRLVSTVHCLQSTEQGSPSWLDLRGAHLNQLPDGGDHLLGEGRSG